MNIIKVYNRENGWLKCVRDQLFCQFSKYSNQFSEQSLGARLADKANKRRDFAQLMVEAMKADKEGNYLTDAESQVASIVLLVAGTDTTSNTMTFVAFLLSKHPHVQERLFQELREAMPDKNATIRLVVWSLNTLMIKNSPILSSQL